MGVRSRTSRAPPLVRQRLAPLVGTGDDPSRQRREYVPFVTFFLTLALLI